MSPDAILQIVTSFVAGAALLALQLVVRGRNAQGERLGKLEDARAFELGRQAGRREVLDERRQLLEELKSGRT